MTTRPVSAPGTALRSFALPDLGEGLTEAEILHWLVAPGETVTLNQPVVEVETAKAAVEVPTPFAGVVHTLHAPAGTTLGVGAALITVETADTAPGGPPVPDEALLVGYGPRPSAERRRRLRRPDASVRPVPAAEPAPAPAAPVPPPPAPDLTGLAKPPVRKLARDLGIDLRSVRGTGPSGSVTRADLADLAGPDVLDADVSELLGAPDPEPVTPGGLHEVAGVHKLSGTHRAMADAMTRSAFTAPHATVFLTVDATETMRVRAGLRSRADFADVPLTPLALIAKAVTVAVRTHASVNATWLDGGGARPDAVEVHERLNLGIAVATPRGLLVPNIKDAGALTLIELAKAIAGLTSTARDGHTRAADLTGGTLSITNVGVFGIDGGIPILNPGETAILCVGTIRPSPWVQDAQLVVRDVVQLSLSFDHRVIDGGGAARFLADVGAMIADPQLMLARI